MKVLVNRRNPAIRMYAEEVESVKGWEEYIVWVDNTAFHFDVSLWDLKEE